MADVTCSRFDAAEYLETEEDMMTFLDECAQDGPEAIALALGAIARARNMSALARETGMTRAGLCKALSPGGQPSFATILKIAGALGFQLGFRAVHQAEKADASAMPGDGRKTTPASTA